MQRHAQSFSYKHNEFNKKKLSWPIFLFIFLLACDGRASKTEGQEVGLSMLEAPDVALQTRDPQQQTRLKETLQTSNGASYTILVFTASWCTACHVDYARNKQQFDTVQKNKTRVISYSMDTRLANWQKLISKRDYIQEAYCDLLGPDSPFVQHLEISTIPRYVLLDRELKIVSTYASSNTREMFDYLKNTDFRTKT